MIQKDNIHKLLEVFFDNPAPEDTGFQLREISRVIQLATPSVKAYLGQLLKEKLIVRKKHRIHGYPVYYANRDNEYFKLLKKLSLHKRIYESGLLNYIQNTCIPDVVVLFGSASRGEDILGSDIDIFIQSKEKKLDLSFYEKKLKRSIHIFFESDFNNLSNELRNNIINGDKMYGYLKVK